MQMGDTMVLIFGGAYQGKLAYALDRFGLSGDDVHMCEDSADIPADKKIIYGIDKWILALINAGMETQGQVQRLIENCPDAVVICNDISCGVVPMDAVMRKWREAVGQALSELSRHSSEVVRLFCGIPTRVK